jgi:hypothetical protein
MRKHHLASIFLLCILSGLNGQPDTNKVKAVYLFQFASVMDWPPESGPFHINVLGNTETTDILKQIALTKKIKSREVEVAEIGDLSTIQDGSILYITSSKLSMIDQALASAKGKKVLIVADNFPEADNSAGIKFITNNSKILFSVNRKVMADCDLILPSLLERLAVK